MTLSLLHRCYQGGIILLGCTLIAIGIALLFLPGPGTPILLFGLAVLGSVFLWARHLQGKLKRAIHEFERAMHRR